MVILTLSLKYLQLQIAAPDCSSGLFDRENIYTISWKAIKIPKGRGVNKSIFKYLFLKFYCDKVGPKRKAFSRRHTVIDVFQLPSIVLVLTPILLLEYS